MSSNNFKCVGADVFIRQKAIPQLPAGANIGPFEYKTASNRGTKVWPGTTPNIDLTDVFGCRFMHKGSGQPDIVNLLAALEKLGFEWVHVEKLHEFNGKPGYSASQGE